MNRLCGSGLQAIVSASQSIMLGDCEVAVAGGAEVMSRAPYWLPGMRWGQRMGDGTAIDAMTGALSDPWDGCHMGVTAENVATDFGVSRADQDELAAESHRRAAAAQAAGYFAEQILPVEIPGKRGKVTVVDTDEHVRPEVRLEDMAKLRPAFAKDGTVTAGNASGINDAAAAVVLASGSFVSRRPDSDGRLVGYAHAGVEPRIMGIGPVPAANVLDRTGVKLDEIDVFEVNEAFAAQALACVRELDLPPERTNPNGSGISLGHPVAATGAILTVKSLYELQADRRPVRVGHDVHRRRPGHRRDLRAGLSPLFARSDRAVTSGSDRRQLVLTLPSIELDTLIECLVKLAEKLIQGGRKWQAPPRRTFGRPEHHPQEPGDRHRRAQVLGRERSAHHPQDPRGAGAGRRQAAQA